MQDLPVFFCENVITMRIINCFLNTKSYNEEWELWLYQLQLGFEYQTSSLFKSFS